MAVQVHSYPASRTNYICQRYFDFIFIIIIIMLGFFWSYFDLIRCLANHFMHVMAKQKVFLLGFFLRRLTNSSTTIKCSHQCQEKGRAVHTCLVVAKSLCC